MFEGHLGVKNTTHIGSDIAPLFGGQSLVNTAQNIGLLCCSPRALDSPDGGEVADIGKDVLAIRKGDTSRIF